MLDFEERRMRQTSFESSVYLLVQSAGICIMIQSSNFVIKRRMVVVPLTIIQNTMIALGFLICDQKESIFSFDKYISIIGESYKFIIATQFGSILFVWSSSQFFREEINTILNNNYEKNQLQIQYQTILENLKVAVISSTKKGGFQYINSEGFGFLKQSAEQTEEREECEAMLKNQQERIIQLKL